MTSLASAGLVTFYACAVVAFAVVSAAAPEEAVDVFLRREDAERFVDEVRDDEPELAELLSIESVELETSPN